MLNGIPYQILIVNEKKKMTPQLKIGYVHQSINHVYIMLMVTNGRTNGARF
jgi:hypothetical protein